jgi:hypothetical protein
VQCSELLLLCLGALTGVLWQTLVIGGGHITVSSNIWKSGLAAPAWGVLLTSCLGTFALTV